VLWVKKLIPLQKHGVVLVMELLNSKINHPDYQCNSTPWGVVLAKRLNSDHFKYCMIFTICKLMKGI
jgi:hydroxypyruvate isomerase